MIELTKSLTDQMVQAILGVCKPVKIILFGSYAYGEPTQDSDVDIAVIEDSVESKPLEAARISRALRPLHIAKDLVVATAREYDFYRKQAGSVFKTIDERGIVLYAR